MSEEDQSPRSRFWAALRDARADLHQVQNGIGEAERLGMKYQVGDVHSLPEIQRELTVAARDLDRVLSSSGYGSSCFPSTAQVSTPIGPRPIAAIRVGDRVLSWSCREARLVGRRVTAVCAHGPQALSAVCLASASRIVTTGNHRFLTRRGWIRADRLRAGDALLRPETSTKGRFVEVTEVVHGLRREPVYNLVTAGEHAYIVDGVVAHNFSRLRILRTWWHRLLRDPADTPPHEIRVGQEPRSSSVY